MLIFLIQWGGARYHPGPVNLLEPVLLVAAGIAAGLIFVPLLERLVPACRRRLRARSARRRRERAALQAERRARALMSELCPHGWQAQITLFEGASKPRPAARELERSADDPELVAEEGGIGLAEPPPAPVALDWAELSGDPTAPPVVMRRVWAPTIGEALEAMVADRRTDETLEQIEHGAAADGALWPDL